MCDQEIRAEAREYSTKQHPNGVHRVSCEDGYLAGYYKGVEATQHPCIRSGCKNPAHTFCEHHAFELYRKGMEKACSMLCGWCSRGKKVELLDNEWMHVNPSQVLQKAVPCRASFMRDEMEDISNV